MVVNLKAYYYYAPWLCLQIPTPTAIFSVAGFMSQMDMGGAILAKEIAHGRVVTVAVESMNFIKPIAVGDVVCCYGQCLSVGRSSIKIKVEVWVKKSRE